MIDIEILSVPRVEIEVKQQVAGVEPVGTQDIYENGRYDVREKAYANVQVNPQLQNKTVTGNGTITADADYYGLDTVIVDVQPMLQNKSVTENGTVTADEGYDGLSAVNVSVPIPPEPVYQERVITENGTYYPESGYDGISKVEVEVQEWLDRSFHDGNDYYWLVLQFDDVSLLTISAKIAVRGKLIIHWGDGDTTTIEEDTSTTSTHSHTYLSRGKYLIKFEILNGYYSIGSTLGANTSMIFTGEVMKSIRPGLRKVEINSKLFLNTDSATSVSGSAFSNWGLDASDIKCVGVLPKFAHYANVRLINCILRDATGIGVSAFDGCKNLSCIKIPATVKRIDGTAFSGCTNCLFYDFTDIELVDGVLPIVFGSTVFSGISVPTKILFRDAETAEVAKETTNLTSYASYITYPGEVAE